MGFETAKSVFSHANHYAKPQFLSLIKKMRNMQQNKNKFVLLKNLNKN